MQNTLKIKRTKTEKEIQEISSVRVTYKSPYTSQEENTFDAKIITNKILIIKKVVNN